MAVWTFGTHCFRAVRRPIPQIVLHGTKESGKSRCLSLLSWTAPGPEYLALATTAASIFRLMEELRADTVDRRGGGASPRDG